MGEGLTDRRALRLCGFGGCCDSHFTLSVANLHGDVDAAADTRIEVHIVKGCGLKTGHLDVNGVVAGCEVCEGKVTALVTCNGTIGEGCVVVNRDPCVWNKRTRAVSDSTGQG